MKSNTLRKYVDLLLFFVACFLTGTGLLIHYRLLPGFRGGHGMTFLGLSRHQWGDYHLWAAYALIALTLIHLIVNYAFIKCVIAARRNWLVVLLGLAGLAIVLLFLLIPIEKSATSGGQGGQNAGKQGAVQDAGHAGQGAGGGQAEHGTGGGRGWQGGRGQGGGQGKRER
jgi:hypothetical protein